MRAILYAIVLHGKQYRNYYLAVVFLLTLGLACGWRTASRLGMETSLQWSGALGSTLSSGQGGVFLRAAFRELRIICLMALCGLGLLGIPAAALLVTLRGFVVGFTLGYLMGNFGSGGLLISLIAVIPQNLILIPAVLYTAVQAMYAPLTKKWGRPYWMSMLAAFVAVIIGVAIEALLSGLLPGAPGM